MIDKNFRGELPLNEFDFARIRRNVMSEVAQHRRPRFAFVLRFAAAMMVAAFVGVISYRAPQPVFAPPPQQKPIPLVVVNPAPLAVLAEEPPAPVERRPSPAAARHPLPARGERGNSRVPIRMEIHTSDPDIRIIWLSNQSPEEES